MAQKNRFLTFRRENSGEAQFHARFDEQKLESAPEATELEPELLAELSRALQVLEAAQGPYGVMNGAEDEAVSLLQTLLTEEAADQRPEILQPGPGATLEAKMDEHDILGWAKSFFTWTHGISKHHWIEAPPEITRIPNKARVALFGDWGSGLYGAPEIAKRIVVTADRYQIVLHLGDTYYSGTESEVKERLLHGWPRVEGAINRTLNGNHEMYTGGNAYYNFALPAFGQSASYFALENDKWILVGLDTAYLDHDLYGGQAQWLNGSASRLGGRRLVLFSHHQPFSLVDSQGPKLVKKLSPLLSGKRIFAWYWGHEHHCVLYEKHGSWDLRGRCVGHGGFPYFREKKIFGDQPPSKPGFRKVGGRNLVPAAKILDGTNPLIPEAPINMVPTAICRSTSMVTNSSKRCTIRAEMCFTRNRSRRRIPLRRHARPEEVAALFAFLASDDAAYVSGHVYTIDGEKPPAGWPAVRPVVSGWWRVAPAELRIPGELGKKQRAPSGERKCRH